MAAAEQANALTDGQQPFVLDVLAMAYAEAGRFDDARQTAAKALDLATAANLPGMASGIRQRLQLYQAGQPFRENPANAAAPEAMEGKP